MCFIIAEAAALYSLQSQMMQIRFESTAGICSPRTYAHVICRWLSNVYQQTSHDAKSNQINRGEYRLTDPKSLYYPIWKGQKGYQLKDFPQSYNNANYPTNSPFVLCLQTLKPDPCKLINIIIQCS